MGTKICFLMCPFGEEGTRERQRSTKLVETIVAPAMEAAGFELRNFLQPNDSGMQEPIHTKMMTYLREADLCVADLTDNNPNVYFEYGVRLGSGLPLFAIIQKGKKLAFDTYGFPTESYDLSNPEIMKERLIKFARKISGFQRETVLVDAERTRQTRLICNYVRNHKPARIDILHFSLLAVRNDLFDAIKQTPETVIRVLLLHPDSARNYGTRIHADVVRETQDLVRRLSEYTSTYREQCPTVGLWYYRHEPSVAVILIDESLVQLGWYLRDPVDLSVSDRNALEGYPNVIVHGHDRPSVLVRGEVVQRVLPSMRAHFISVFRAAELADPEWGVVGPKRAELLAEWEQIKCGRSGARFGHKGS
jgi:hypothetical protein